MWEVSGEQAFVPHTRQIQKDASTKHPWLSPKLQKTHQLLGTSLQVVDEMYKAAFSLMCLESARGASTGYTTFDPHVCAQLIVLHLRGDALRPRAQFHWGITSPFPWKVQ